MKFRDPLPISKKWSALIRCVLFGLPIVILVAGFRMGSTGGQHPHHKTMMVCTELEQAVLRFHDDYDVPPIKLGGDLVIDCNSAKGLELLHVLLNQEDAESPANAKGIKYMSVRQGSHQRDGLIWNKTGTQVEGLYDPWGGSYMIAIDGDGDGEITVQPKAQKEPRTLQRKVAVWSNGENPNKAKDDVTTW